MKSSALSDLLGPADAIIMSAAEESYFSKFKNKDFLDAVPMRRRRSVASSGMKKSVVTLHRQIWANRYPAGINPKTGKPHTYEQEIARRLRQQAKIAEKREAEYQKYPWLRPKAVA